MELGSRIKQYRSTHGWNQDDLAEKMYVTRQTISNWENDKSYPDLQSLLLLGSLRRLPRSISQGRYRDHAKSH